MKAKKGLLAAGFVLQGLGIYWVLVALYNMERVVRRYSEGECLDSPVGAVFYTQFFLSNITTILMWALLSIILAAALFAVVHFMNRPRRLAKGK